MSLLGTVAETAAILAEAIAAAVRSKQAGKDPIAVFQSIEPLTPLEQLRDEALAQAGFDLNEPSTQPEGKR